MDDPEFHLPISNDHWRLCVLGGAAAMTDIPLNGSSRAAVSAKPGVLPAEALRLWDGTTIPPLPDRSEVR